MVREPIADAGKVVFNRCQVPVHACLQQEFKLRLMELKPVDLLMLKREASYDGPWIKQRLSGMAQPRIGGQGFVRAQPRTRCAFRHIQVRTLAKDTLGRGERVAEVIRRDRLKNDLERIGLVLSGCSGEAVQTFLAPKKLDGLKTVSPFAFSYGIRRMTLRTGRVLLLALNVAHGELGRQEASQGEFESCFSGTKRQRSCQDCTACAGLNCLWRPLFDAPLSVRKFRHNSTR